MEIYVLLIGVLIILGTLIEIGKNGNWSAAFAVPGRRPVWSVNFCFWLMIGGILILFGGLRYQVGDDFDSYYLIFEYISEDWGSFLYEGTDCNHFSVRSGGDLQGEQAGSVQFICVFYHHLLPRF